MCAKEDVAELVTANSAGIEDAKGQLPAAPALAMRESVHDAHGARLEKWKCG